MAGCNCAIMLITDGAPNNFQDVFDQAKNNTDVQVRCLFLHFSRKQKDSLLFASIFWSGYCVILNKF